MRLQIMVDTNHVYLVKGQASVIIFQQTTECKWCSIYSLKIFAVYTGLIAFLKIHTV